MNIKSSAWNPANTNETPADYIAAWQFVVNRFKNTDGVNNVKWIWSPNIDCNSKCPFNAYFPGNSYVDIEGLDGYNYASLHGVNWESFSNLFQNIYDNLIRLAPGIPVDIAEVGSAEANSIETSIGDSKAAWVQQMTSSITSNMPRVTSVTWWEGASEHTSFEIQSSSSALLAWQNYIINNPNFQGKLQ